MPIKEGYLISGEARCFDPERFVSHIKSDETIDPNELGELTNTDPSASKFFTLCVEADSKEHARRTLIAHIMGIGARVIEIFDVRTPVKSCDGKYLFIDKQQPDGFRSETPISVHRYNVSQEDL